MTKLLDRVCALLAVVAALLFLFMTFTICYSIFTRALSLPTPVWTVQLNEYAMLWITFLGTAWLLSKEKHVSIQIVTSRLGAKGKRAFRVIHDVMGLLLCAAIGYFGAFTAWEHFERNVIDVQAIDVPKAFVIVVIPLGFLLLSLQFLRRTVDDLRGKKAGGQDARSDSAGSKERKTLQGTVSEKLEG